MNNNKVVENWKCPKCGFVGTARHGIVGQSVNIGYNKKERHPFREPNTPVEGIFCSRCGHCKLIGS